MASFSVPFKIFSVGKAFASTVKIWAGEGLGVFPAVLTVPGSVCFYGIWVAAYSNLRLLDTTFGQSGHLKFCAVEDKSTCV